MDLGDIMAKKNETANLDMNIGSFVKIIVAILVILVIFTVITKVVTDKNNNEVSDNTIQYTKILAGSIMNRSEKDYYVLVYDNDDTNVGIYQSYIATYNNKENHLRVYTVDLDDPFNANYLATDANYSSSISELKFNETVLLHIKEGKITSYRLGSDISTYLKSLSA